MQLDVVDVVSSPTFSIVNEYQTENKSRVYHFDFYRLEEEKEAYDMGYEEYFFSDDYCFIEWAEKIPSLIGEDMVIVKMHIEETKRAAVIFPEGTRTIPGSRTTYQPGAAAFYRHLKLPVVPVAVNSGMFWPKHSAVKRPGKIVLEFLTPIKPGLAKAAFNQTLENRIESATDKLIAEARE